MSWSETMLLKDKVCVITGGANGIGKGIALCMAKEGANVAILDLNDTEGEKTLNEIKSHNVKGLYINSDVTNPESLAEAQKKISSELGNTDVLVVNAGISFKHSFKEVSDEEVETRLTNSQNNLAELVVKETAAENGDTVVIDFVGSVDGVEFDGGKGENLFFHPAVVTNISKDDPIFTDEIFGPVAPVLIFDDIEEAIEVVNSSKYGLAVAIHTARTAWAFELAKKIKSDGAKTLLPMINSQAQGLVSETISSLLPITQSKGGLMANMGGGFIASQTSGSNLTSISGIAQNNLPQYLKSPFDKN